MGFGQEMRKNGRKSLGILVVDRLCSVLGLLVAVATFLGFLGKLHWTLDMFSHFRVQYFQFCLILIGVSLWVRNYKRGLALGLVAVLNYAFVLPFYFGGPSPADGQTVRAMLMNLNAANGNTALVLDVLEKFDPDFVLLEEVTPKWADKPEPLATRFPYKVSEPRGDCFGILFFSKVPLSNSRVVSLGSEAPTIITDVRLPQGTLSLIGTHPPPPVGAANARARNEQLAALAGTIREQQHPVLLIGDLNTSPWSPYFSQLLKESGLRNSMKGFGFQPSWPVENPLMRIPIDHMLHSPEITVHQRGIGPEIGSDHLPLIVDFSVQ